MQVAWESRIVVSEYAHYSSKRLAGHDQSSYRKSLKNLGRSQLIFKSNNICRSVKNPAMKSWWSQNFKVYGSEFHVEVYDQSYATSQTSDIVVLGSNSPIWRFVNQNEITSKQLHERDASNPFETVTINSYCNEKNLDSLNTAKISRLLPCWNSRIIRNWNSFQKLKVHTSYEVWEQTNAYNARM